MISGSLRWRPDDDENPLVTVAVRADPEAVEAEDREDGRVGSEVGEVVVLLEARVADQLRRLCAGGLEAVDRDRIGDDHAPRGLPGELALQARVLVILHLRLRDPQRRADGCDVDGAVGDREVEAPRAGPAAQGGAAAGEGECLRPGRCAAVTAERFVCEAEALEQAFGLAVVAGGDRDLVTALAEQRDHRPQHDRMGRGRAVDPDPQTVATDSCG